MRADCVYFLKDWQARVNKSTDFDIFGMCHKTLDAKRIRASYSVSNVEYRVPGYPGNLYLF